MSFSLFVYIYIAHHFMLCKLWQSPNFVCVGLAIPELGLSTAFPIACYSYYLQFSAKISSCQAFIVIPSLDRLLSISWMTYKWGSQHCCQGQTEVRVRSLLLIPLPRLMPPFIKTRSHTRRDMISVAPSLSDPPLCTQSNTRLWSMPILSLFLTVLISKRIRAWCGEHCLVCLLL